MSGPLPTPALLHRDGAVLGFVLVGAGAVLWGLGGLTGAALHRGEDMGMLTVACLRLLVGGGVLLLALALSRRLAGLPRTRPALLRVVVTGAMAAVYQGAYFLAVSYVDVAVATLVTLGSVPVLVVLATAVQERRRPGARVLVALVLALAGLLLLVGVPETSGGNAVLGAVLAVTAAGAFATLTMVNRRAAPGLDPAAVTGLAFTFGGLLVLPAALATGWSMPSAAGGWLLLLFLGLGPTAAAYVLFLTGLPRVRPPTAALLTLLEPLTATVGAVVLLSEPLPAVGIVGALLLAGAVATVRPREGG